MQDITKRSEQELSLLVFNTESLYNARHTEGFLDILEHIYIFTEEQKLKLLEDLVEDREELRKEELEASLLPFLLEPNGGTLDD